MRNKLLLAFLALGVVGFLLYSCATNPSSGVVKTVVLSVNSSVEAEKYVVSLSKPGGAPVFEGTFEPKAEIRIEGLKLPFGEYQIAVRALVNGQIVGEDVKVVGLKSEVAPLSTPFVLSVKATLDVPYYSRAKNFRVMMPSATQLELRYKEESGADYDFYVLMQGDNTWIPIDDASGITFVPEAGGYKKAIIPLYNNKILFKDGRGRSIKAIDVNAISLFGVNVKKDDKVSGISPAPLIYQVIEDIDGRIRSTPAVWKNPDTDKIYVFVTADDGKLRVYNYDPSNKKLVYKDAKDVGCFGTMSPVVEEFMYGNPQRRAVNVYVGGKNASNPNAGTVYKFVFDPQSLEQLILLRSVDVDGRVESTPIFVNNHLFVTDYAGKYYVIRPTDMGIIRQGVLGKSPIVTSPVAVDNDHVITLSASYTGTGGVPSEPVPGDEVVWYVRRLNMTNPLEGATVTHTASAVSFFRGSNYYRTALGSSPAYDATATAIYFGTMDGLLYRATSTNLATQAINLTLGRIEGSPVIDNAGDVYVGTDAGYIVKVSGSTYNTLWKYYTGNDVRGVRDSVRSTPLLGNDGNLYVGSYEGYIYALRQSDGQILWRYQVDDRVWGSPSLIPGEKILIIGGHDKKLYLIKIDATNVEGRWPKFRQNLLNN